MISCQENESAIDERAGKRGLNIFEANDSGSGEPRPSVHVYSFYVPLWHTNILRIPLEPAENSLPPSARPLAALKWSEKVHTAELKLQTAYEGCGKLVFDLCGPKLKLLILLIKNH